MINEYLKFQSEVRSALEQWYTTEEAHSMSHLYITSEAFLADLTVEETVMAILESNKPNYTPKWKRNN